jgi:hypothetical protein
MLTTLQSAAAGILAVARVATDGFCCPLCLRFLPLQCASEAHAPARKLGGRSSTFLCKACNNFLGFSYEAAAVEALTQVRAQAAGHRIPYRAALAVPGGPHLFVEALVGASKAIETEGTSPPQQMHDINIHHRKVDHALIERFNAARRAGDGRITIQTTAPSELDFKLAVLSWAYLSLFARLGYAVVFSPAGRAARYALLERTLDGFDPTPFFTFGQFEGVIAPTQVGLLMALTNPRGRGPLIVGLAVQFGLTVCVLPHAEDKTGLSKRLPEFVNDDDYDLVVVPFDALYPPARIDLGVGAQYGIKEDSGEVLYVKVDPVGAQADLGRAAAPPTRPIRRSTDWPSNTGWPPPVPSLPPSPVAETWRDFVAEYLTRRDPELGSLWRATSDPQAAVQAIAARDPIASFHAQDIFDLYVRCLPPRLASDPDSARIMPMLAKMARELDRDAHVIAGDFRSASPTERITAHSIRVLRGDQDLIVGPHLRYSTLVQALEITLRAPSGGGTTAAPADTVA